MSNSHSIADARRNLPTLIREAENGKAVTLTRRGTPVAVIMGRSLYDQLSTGRRTFSETFVHFAQTAGLAKLALDPDELFADVRESLPGRDVQF